MNDRFRTLSGLQLWALAKPAAGTLVTAYFKSRGIAIGPPHRLKFLTNARHPAGGNWPCMVALVTLGANDRPIAVHRTFLAADGRGKAAVDPAKMMLGPCRGGAVRLAPASGTLLVGEGIETCLSAMQATGLAAWAALSTAGLTRLELPHSVKDVIILADGDEPGRRAAARAASRWVAEKRRVRIATAPIGTDFNDLLLDTTSGGGGDDR